ncbi:MAG: radical SAM protein, partial [Phycisphaerae bacterium]
CKYFLLPPGQAPSELVYPVWTQDVKRSMQVVDGRYFEITPISFEFVPTLNCIHRCHECAYRVPKEAMGLWQHNDFANTFHMDMPTMRRLLDKLKAADINEVLFTGGGEPLLNRGTPEAMNYATEIGIPRVGLYTNGALITPASARAVLAAAPAYIRVSLNSGTPGVYRQHHNPLDSAIDYFERTLEGIEFLAKAKQTCGSKSSLGISYLVDANNVGDVTEAARLVAKTAGRYDGMVNYMRFTPSVNYYGLKQHRQDMFKAAVARIKNEAVPILKEAGIGAPVYDHRFNGLYEPRTYTQCLASGWYGGLGPGGVLYWCCEKLFHPDFSFGSLLDKSLAEVWAGPERRAVAQHVSEAVLGGTCSPCPVVCKPHEHNKVFAQVERLRAAGKIAIVATWLQQIHELKRHQLLEPTLFNFNSQCEQQS